jgi:hypothetical protein
MPAKKGVEIAEVIGCSQATVSRTLDAWVDTRPIARRLLEAGSIKLAQTVINTKNTETALKALGKLDVVREDKQEGGNQLVVMLGSGGGPLEPPNVP